VKRRIERGLATGVALAIVCAMFVTRAEAIDLSGTWEGKRTCTGISGGDGTHDNFPQDMIVVVSQTGSALYFHFINDATRYNGQLVLDASAPGKRGTATLVECGTSKDLPEKSEMVQVDFTNFTKKGLFVGPHKMSGDSVLLWQHGDQFTCKWNLTWMRSHTEAPQC